MSISASHPDRHQDTQKRYSKRERWTYLLIVIFIALIVSGVRLTYQYLNLSPPLSLIGDIAEFSPSANPYLVHVDDVTVFVINRGGNYLVLDRRATHLPTRFPVQWIPSHTRFEDPLSGAKYSLEGEYIEGPAQRGMDRYDHKIVDNQLWINLNKIIEGWPASESPVSRAFHR